MVKLISLGLIRENVAALRSVNRKSEKYLGLIESMRINGFMGAIVARERTDPDTEAIYYELCDGLHRYSAAKEAGIAEISVDIRDLNDDQVLEAQIMANFHKIETKPAEYSKGLKRILTRNPLMTESELAARLGVTSKFIRARLSLNKITNQEVLTLIDENKIPLSNAYLLSKLPEDEMSNFIDAAITEPPAEFIPKATERLKEIKEAAKAGRKAGPITFTAVAHMQKMKDIKDELENGETIAVLISGIEDPAQAATRVLEWILHLDPKSLESAEASWNEKQSKKKAAAEAKKAEKEAKKQEAADKANASLV